MHVGSKRLMPGIQRCRMMSQMEKAGRSFHVVQPRVTMHDGMPM